MKKLPKAIIVCAWMAILSIGIGLLVRYSQFKPVYYDIYPGDNRALKERFSTIFCQSLTVTKHRVFIDVIQLENDGKRSKRNHSKMEMDFDDKTNDDTIYLVRNSNLNTALKWSYFNMTTMVPDNSYTYWGFYLNPGSKIIVNYRTGSNTTEFLAIRGNNMFEKWRKTGDCILDSCKMSYVMDNGTYNTDTISRPDTYFFIFQTDPSGFKLGPGKTAIETEFKVGQTTYNYQTYTQKCNLVTKMAPSFGNKTMKGECKFSLRFSSKEFVLVQAPMFTDKAHTYVRYVDKVTTECEPRILAYVLICTFAPVAFVLICLILITILCSPRNSEISQNRENSHDCQSSDEWNFPSQRNFPSDERQPLLQESPPLYSEL